MRATRQLLCVDAIQFRQQQTGVANRVYANVPPAPVRRTPVYGNLEPNESLVRRHDSQAGRLRDDRRIRANAARYERRSSDAAPFLVHGGRHDYITGQLAAHSSGRGTHGCDPSFHVARASTVKTAVAHNCVEGRVCHALDAYHIDVAIEQERLATLSDSTAYFGDDVRAPGGGLDQLGFQSPVIEYVGEQPRDFTFARSVGCQ